MEEDHAKMIEVENALKSLLDMNGRLDEEIKRMTSELREKIKIILSKNERKI